MTAGLVTIASVRALVRNMPLCVNVKTENGDASCVLCSPEDIGAWDMVMQANSLFWRLTKDEGEAAIAMLRRAVERYPNYAPAHSMLAFMLLVSGYAAWTLSELEPQVRQAETLATRATTLDDSDPWAHLALGYVAGSAIPTLHRSEPELRCRSRLFWLGPCA